MFHYNISTCLSCALLIVTSPRIVLYLFPSSCPFFAFPPNIACWYIIWYMCIYVYIHMSRFHIWEMWCNVCLSELGLFYFARVIIPCSYIFLLVTWFYSLYLIKTVLCVMLIFLKVWSSVDSHLGWFHIFTVATGTFFWLPSLMKNLDQ